MPKLFCFFLLGLTILPAWSCRPANRSETIAEIDGDVITRTELNQSAGKALANAREQLYKLERQKLDEYIGATLLTREAKNRNVSVTTLLEQEVDGQIPAIADEEVRAFYDSHKDRLQVDYGKAREKIRDFLRDQKIQERRALLVSSLRSKASIKTYLTPPQAYRAQLSISGAPSKGAEKAAVTMVKFEDFQCPYCKTVQPRFLELLKKYDGKIRIVHKDLPLEEIHPQARQAAEAARCAGDQGKFWEYHDKLYERSPKASVDDLKAYAKELGLEVSGFDRCIASGRFRAAVQKDLMEGAALGLTGTPAFFINGRELSGAQPLEAFTAIIDEELAVAK
jgi:protein-disulfide isomerase